MVSKFIAMCEGSYLQNHSFRGHPTDHRITAAESQPAWIVLLTLVSQRREAGATSNFKVVFIEQTTIKWQS